jgi:polyphosphate kinase
LGLFTADEDMASDVSALFNLLTGYSQGHKWSKLVVAPESLQKRTVELIDEQTERAENGKPSRILAKLNSLVDSSVIKSLYRASQAGVSVDLIVRGICCLRPGIPGVSENIRVRSIVDRFLEHSRIFVFGPDDDAKVFLSSADWMPRNFYRRVEIMFPLESPAIKKRIISEILPFYLADNVKARELRQNGTYRRVKAGADVPSHRAQSELLELHFQNALKKKQTLGRSLDKDLLAPSESTVS